MMCIYSVKILYFYVVIIPTSLKFYIVYIIHTIFNSNLMICIQYTLVQFNIAFEKNLNLPWVIRQWCPSEIDTPKTI